MKRPDHSGGIGQFLQSDRAILVISIGVALIFWLLLKLSHSYKTTKDFPIIFDLPEGKSLVQSPPHKVSLGLEGRGFDLIYFSLFHEIPAIRYLLADQATQSISASQIMNKARGKLSNLNVIEVDQDYIMLHLDDAFEKKVPVKLVSKIVFENGFQLKDSIRLQPDSVRLSGPYTIVDGYTEWETVPLELENVRAGFEEELSLVPPFDKVVQLGPAFVQVQVDVEQFTEKSFFVPLIVKNAPDSIKIFPDKIKVSGTVGLSHYNALEEADFGLEVDLKGIPLQTENNTLPVSIVKTPSSMRNIQINPKSVEFFFVSSDSIPPQ